MIRTSKILLAVLNLLILASSVIAAEPIRLHLDARDAPRRRLQAHLVIPAKPGPLTLVYPKWIAGEHAPTGPITDLSGVKIRAGDNAVAWKRDELDMFAFHLVVPDGATKLDVDVEFLSPPTRAGFSGAASMTAQLAVLYWNHVLLYPAGSVMQQTDVEPSLTLPKDWKMASALPITATDADGEIHFKTVTLERLCDSPVLCGRYFKEIALGPADG